jgi:molybdenum cofactor synthesis domain-containing protein
MKSIRTVDAVGHVLCHDITQIIRGVTKDARFRKGDIIKEEDIPVLLSLGKDHIYVWEKDENMLHENEAAEILRQICQNDGMEPTEVKEGKIELKAMYDGVFKVDVDRLNAINDLDDIIIATRHNNVPVKKGDKLAGTRVIPLVIGKDKMEELLRVAGDEPLLQLLPYRKLKVGVVTTGNEVFQGRIKDTFTPVIADKLAAYGLEIEAQRFSDDDPQHILTGIRELLELGMEMIFCTGGMSVDPDDRTPAAIRDTGAEIVTYGVPVLPGAMFLLAYYAGKHGTVPICGLPGCVMYARTTIFDLVLPRLVAGERVTKKSMRGLGHGGICLECKECRYPNCSFGKGI